MKKFLTIAGLLTLVATPAFAQSFDSQCAGVLIRIDRSPERQNGSPAARAKFFRYASELSLVAWAI
jgi:hypothetical protein